VAVGAVVGVVVEVVWMLWLRPVSSSDGVGYPNGDLVGGFDIELLVALAHSEG